MPSFRVTSASSIFSLAFAVGADGEVLHVAGVVAVGTIEPVLLAVGIEMSTGRFEVGALALGDLMEMDGMFSGREIVEFELERDARPLIPDDDFADGFALSIFEFNFGLGRAGVGRATSAREQSEGDDDRGSSVL